MRLSPLPWIILALLGAPTLDAASNAIDCGSRFAELAEPDSARFLDSLGEALASNKIPENALKGFMDSMLYEESRLPQAKEAILSYISLDDNAISRSATRPVHIEISYPHSNEGVTLFKGAVFANRFFMRRASSFGHDDKGWKALLESQSSLSWNPRAGKLEWHAGNPGLAILDRFEADAKSAALRIYRGTFPEEARLATAWKAMESGNASAALENLENLISSPADGMNSELLSALKTATEEVKASRSPSPKELHASASRLLSRYAKILDAQPYRGLFVTPDPDSAKGFAKGAWVSYEIPMKALRGLVQDHSVYVGFEGEYLELGFRGKKALEVLFRSMKESQTSNPNGNIWSQEGGSIWRTWKK